jgi:hypothetical protein
MPETPGEQPESSHGEAGQAGESVRVERRDATNLEQQPEATTQEEEE